MTHSLTNDRHRKRPDSDHVVAALRKRILHLMLAGEDASLNDIVRVLRADSTLSHTVLLEASGRQESDDTPVFRLKRAVQLLGLRRISSLLQARATAV